MNLKLRFGLTLLICVSLVFITVPAHAQLTGTGPIGVGGFNVRAIVIGLVAAGAATGVGVYLFVRHAPSITGYVTIRASNLSLQNESDQRTYTLIGDIANIKGGDRIRVLGKKAKEAAGKWDFVVEKLKRDFSPCKALQATP